MRIHERKGRWKQPEFGGNYNWRCKIHALLLKIDQRILRHKWQWLCHQVLDTPYFLPCYDGEWDTYPTAEMLGDEEQA